jgi:hypothetical protein
MLTFTIKYFLPLCIHFLFGYTQPTAISSWEGNLYSFLESIEVAEQDNLKEEKAPAFNTVSSITGNKLILEFTEVEEEEDDDKTSSKKHYKSCNPFKSLFSAHQTGYFIQIVKSHLSFSRHFSDISSYRKHLVFQVFRI